MACKLFFVRSTFSLVLNQFLNPPCFTPPFFCSAYYFNFETFLTKNDFLNFVSLGFPAFSWFWHFCLVLALSLGFLLKKNYYNDIQTTQAITKEPI